MTQGAWDDRFQPVVDEFARNFDERGEGGASLCITHGGTTVVDVWGGTFDRDTVSIVHSCTKGATALAGMYTPLALDDGRLVDHETLEAMRRVSVATNDDATLRIATRFALGFMVSMDNRNKAEKDSVVLGQHGFGHVGAGGSIGFADPSIGLAFGYSMDRMGPGILLNERGQSLVDATYRVLAGGR